MISKYCYAPEMRGNMIGKRKTSAFHPGWIEPSGLLGSVHENLAPAARLRIEPGTPARQQTLPILAGVVHCPDICYLNTRESIHAFPMPQRMSNKTCSPLFYGAITSCKHMRQGHATWVILKIKTLGVLVIKRTPSLMQEEPETVMLFYISALRHLSSFHNRGGFSRPWIQGGRHAEGRHQLLLFPTP